MVQSKNDIIELLTKNKNEILSFGVERLGLFGSFVRNEQKPDSDIDFLVDFYPEKKTFRNLVGLADFLEDKTGRKVEVVTKKGLSKYFGHHILNSTEYVIQA